MSFYYGQPYGAFGSSLPLYGSSATAPFPSYQGAYSPFQSFYGQPQSYGTIPSALGFQVPHAQPTGPRIKVHYFDVKGRAESVRLALLLAGIPFEDVRYSPEQWGEAKAKMPFGQVPVLEVGDQMLAQTFAILRYVGRLTNLYPTDPWAAAKVDEFLYTLDDFGQIFKPLFDPESDDEKKAKAFEKILTETAPKHASNLEKLITKNGTGFAVGTSLTIADLFVQGFYSFVTKGVMTFKGLGEDFFDKYPGINEVHRRVSELPQVQAWNAKHAKKAEEKKAEEKKE